VSAIHISASDNGFVYVCVLVRWRHLCVCPGLCHNKSVKRACGCGSQMCPYPQSFCYRPHQHNTLF